MIQCLKTNNHILNIAYCKAGNGPGIDEATFWIDLKLPMLVLKFSVIQLTINNCIYICRWFGCPWHYCGKYHGPGHPTMCYGFETSEKWYQCGGEVAIQDLRQGQESVVEGERGWWCNVLLRWTAGEVGLSGVDSANEETHLSRLHEATVTFQVWQVWGRGVQDMAEVNNYKQLQDVELAIFNCFTINIIYIQSIAIVLWCDCCIANPYTFFLLLSCCQNLRTVY